MYSVYSHKFRNDKSPNLYDVHFKICTKVFKIHLGQFCLKQLYERKERILIYFSVAQFKTFELLTKIVSAKTKYILNTYTWFLIIEMFQH